MQEVDIEYFPNGYVGEGTAAWFFSCQVLQKKEAILNTDVWQIKVSLKRLSHTYHCWYSLIWCFDDGVTECSYTSIQNLPQVFCWLEI